MSLLDSMASLMFWLSKETIQECSVVSLLLAVNSLVNWSIAFFL